MSKEQISREEESHIEILEDEMDEQDELYNCCCCKDRLIDELETRDRIRSVVMPGTMLYDGDDIRRFLTFLAMYPSLATVSEVVEDMTAYYEDYMSD